MFFGVTFYRNHNQERRMEQPIRPPEESGFQNDGIELSNEGLLCSEF